MNLSRILVEDQLILSELFATNLGSYLIGSIVKYQESSL